MPPERRGTDTERDMIMGPGVLYDTTGNEPRPIGFGAPGESLLAPPVPGSAVPGGAGPDNPPPSGANVGVPRTPTAPRGTAAPRTPATRPPRGSTAARRQGGIISRALRNLAGRLRGGNRQNG